MQPSPERILKTYLTLTLLSTFASSFIWGVNTLFLLDAGLTITQAFAANAFFTVGQVLFEVPTGVVADSMGRRVSYLLGAATLFFSTIFYLFLWQIEGPFWAWALSSVFLGLGFTFFSGATEAWLVDALKATKYKGSLDSAFAKGQIASGIAMLTGTLTGGVVAQFTNLGVPYILRAVVLGISFFVTLALMQDVGFTPKKSASPVKAVRELLKASIDEGLRKPSVRWMMLAGPFTFGVGFYGFYAMQPFLLELYGRTDSYAIAGLAAAITASTQIIGGLLVPYVRRAFARRTSLLFTAISVSSVALVALGFVNSFWLALALLGVWAMAFAMSIPVRQAYLNGLIPSAQRATVLSSDNLIGSAGGIFTQPGLGKVADVYSYSTSFVASAAVQLLALPFIFLARTTHATSDRIADTAAPQAEEKLPGV